jgi:hypothetical protein
VFAVRAEFFRNAAIVEHEGMSPHSLPPLLLTGYPGALRDPFAVHSVNLIDKNAARE